MESMIQMTILCGIVLWIYLSSLFNLTQKLRSFIQPWVSNRVRSQLHIILEIQKHQHGILDALFSSLSCVVSVPFYTAFLPLLFWSGHGKLARQMTLLMAFCDYMGNCVKDMVSAPRPDSPPVRRITATEDEKENALEYGLPSSHTLNTVCLSGYLLHYVLSYMENEDAAIKIVGFAIVFLFVGLIGYGKLFLLNQFVGTAPSLAFCIPRLHLILLSGRIYLGMHSLIDVIGGLGLGFITLTFWLLVHEYIDNFVVSGQNVASFWSALTFLLLFAYPKPESPTPSFEYHTAFSGVALGIVAGVQQTYHQFHHDKVPRIFTSQLSVPMYTGRVFGDFDYTTRQVL